MKNKLTMLLFCCATMFSACKQTKSSLEVSDENRRTNRAQDNESDDSNEEALKFDGKWVYIENDDEYDANLVLEQNQNLLKGSHTIVKGMGDEIDSSFDEDDMTIDLTINENGIASGKINSSYGKIEVTLNLVKADTLFLKCEPGTSLFFGEMKFVRQ